MLERAANVAEPAAAVKRPRSTVAHNVNVLVEAGMLRVVRTRRVRAIDALLRAYGSHDPRGRGAPPGDTTTPVCVDGLSVAAAESVPAHEADTLYPTDHPHAARRVLTVLFGCSAGEVSRRSRG
ncbi:hypothetical protein [Actinophytocola sp.]|uniref:hypothetical protein n=1 Tax=Actinophytocola sp. TaxID=1872138 RepID=UPI003D6B016A